jgi:hypothetical protein
MADRPPDLCLYCLTPLKSGDLTVFHADVKIGHVRCWRPTRPKPLASQADPVEPPFEVL